MIKAFIWLLIFLMMGLPLFHGPSNRLLELAALHHRFLTGGLIFLAMGLLGETLKARTAGRELSFGGLFRLALMWWLCGIAAGLIFPLVNLGVGWSQVMGLLPGGGFSSARRPLTAVITSFFFTGPFFTSIILNLMVIPVWMLRRVLLSAASSRPQYFWPGAETSLNRAVKTVNWSAFIKTETIQTILIRIPFITLVIMMPEKFWLYLTGWLLIIMIMLEDAGTRFWGGAEKKKKPPIPPQGK
ncbi:hypothetical protein C4J81_04310 [Deltaproteobacteria bacterium Smac51]|nr:hypothetical protein C4J81_04310 [Deltaproteobacteria bacterium Smac51]